MARDVELKELGRRIRTLRLRLGLTQEQLAEMSNLHHSYIGQVERGEKLPSLRTLKKLAEAMHTSVDFFLEEQAPYDPHLDDLRRELLALLQGCSHQEMKLIVEIVRLLVTRLRNLSSPRQE
jgi:transcriptional regulator with XRE-family HTH domain